MAAISSRSTSRAYGRKTAIFALLLSTGLPTASAYAQSPKPAVKPPAKKAPASTPAPDPDRAAFGLAPSTGGKPDARPNFSYGVTPGGQQLDEVTVVNIGLKPVTVRLYATDAKLTADGVFDLLPGQEKPKDVGSWIQLGSGSDPVTVPARSRVAVQMKLVVPRDASPGDHTGGVIAALNTEAKNEKGDTVVLEQRVATRLRVRVSGELKPKLAITGMTAKYSAPGSPFGSGTMRVQYVVRNAGNVRLTGKQVLSIKGLFGGAVQAKDLVDIPELLPGSSFAVSSVITGVRPTVRLTATATATPVGREGDVNPPLVAVTESVSVWAVPWILLAIVVLLIAAFTGLRLRRRRRDERTATAVIEAARSHEGAGGGAGTVPAPAGAVSAQGERTASHDSATERAEALGRSSRDQP